MSRISGTIMFLYLFAAIVNQNNFSIVTISYLHDQLQTKHKMAICIPAYFGFNDRRKLVTCYYATVVRILSKIVINNTRRWFIKKMKRHVK